MTITKERIREFIEKERGGEILCKKFHAISNSEDTEIRPTLGDFVDLRFSALHELYVTYFYPMAIYEVYRAGTVLGYNSTSKIEKDIDSEKTLKELDIFSILQNKKMKSSQLEYWRAKKIGVPILGEIDKEKKILNYEISETPSAIIKKTDQKLCFYPLGVLNGQLQMLSKYYCNSTEQKCVCEGFSSCHFKIFMIDDKERIVFQMQDRENLTSVMDALIDSIIANEKTVTRSELGDLVHISMNQAINYLLLSISKGHLVLSKWAGKKLGERIAEKSKQTSLIKALDFLNELFLRLKVGIVETELTPENIKIKMKESVYSAGVENIEMTLCAFIAGIIHGMLNKSTDLKWVVREVECLANGDEICEFLCQTENPEALKHLLLGG